MTDVRKARDAAISRRLRDLDDDRERWMPVLLDELEAIGPTDAELTAWVEAHPAEFAAWMRRQNRLNGAPPPFDAPAKPAAPRRTRRAAPKGGTA